MGRTLEWKEGIKGKDSWPIMPSSLGTQWECNSRIPNKTESIGKDGTKDGEEKTGAENSAKFRHRVFNAFPTLIFLCGMCLSEQMNTSKSLTF